MLRKLIVFALILCVVMPTLAQVEFHTELESFDALEDAPIMGLGLSKKDENTVDYLYLMNQEDEFCTADIHMSDDPDYDTRVCVFEDPESDSQFLYIDSYHNTNFLVFYNGQIIAVLSREQGISDLDFGEYEVLLFYHNFELVGKVTFTITDPREAADFNTEIVPTDGLNKYRGLSTEHRTIAEYLYRTQRDKFCTDDIPSKGTRDHTRVCVFKDPRTGERFLYVNETEERNVIWASSGNFRYTNWIIFHNGQIAGLLGGSRGGSGIADLAPGEYEMLVIYHYGVVGTSRLPIYRFGSVSFTIPDSGEESAGD